MHSSVKILYLLLALSTLQACKTVQPPTHPVANMFPTVDITAKLEALKPCPITAEQLQKALQSMNIWNILLTAGMPASEVSTLARGLNERGYAEIDARRASSPLLWVSFTSIDNSKTFIRAAFANIPPYNCRQGLLLEKQPGDKSIRTLTRNGRTIPQRVAVWQAYQREDGLFQIQQIFVAGKANTVSHWEIYWELSLANDAS